MEKNRKRAKEYFLTPEGKEKHRKRMNIYMKTIRHIDSILCEVMGENEALSLEEISKRIRKSRNVRMKPSTIEGLLSKYIEKYGDSPLETIDGEKCKLNPNFYNKIQKKFDHNYLGSQFYTIKFL